MINIRQIENIESYNSFKENEKVVLIFHANWCGPCRVLDGIVSKLDITKVNDFIFGEINVDDDFAEEITKTYSIRNIPVTVILKNGKEIERIVGIFKSEDIYKKLNKI